MATGKAHGAEVQVQAIHAFGLVCFMAASLVLGLRLVRLGLRTREVPELAIGGAFLLAGFVGWGCFSAIPLLRSAGADVAVVHACVTAGLGFVLAGSLANGAGVVLIFRRGSRASLVALGAIALFEFGAFVAFLRVPVGEESWSFWIALAPTTVVYAWLGIESWLLGDALRRRSRLGLADPLAAHRALLWAVASGATVALISSAIASRLLVGPVPPASVTLFQSACGLVAALAVWIGFFPPTVVRRRLAAVVA